MTVPEIDAWCARSLNAGIDETLFEAGHLSRVLGVRLNDGREVVVKVRPLADRLVACADVQGALWGAGFPCPQPLAGPVPWKGHAINAEVFVPGGEILGIAGAREVRCPDALAIPARL